MCPSLRDFSRQLDMQLVVQCGDLLFQLFLKLFHGRSVPLAIIAGWITTRVARPQRRRPALHVRGIALCNDETTPMKLRFATLISIGAMGLAQDSQPPRRNTYHSPNAAS